MGSNQKYQKNNMYIFFYFGGPGGPYIKSSSTKISGQEELIIEQTHVQQRKRQKITTGFSYIWVTM